MWPASVKLTNDLAMRKGTAGPRFGIVRGGEIVHVGHEFEHLARPCILVDIYVAMERMHERAITLFCSESFLLSVKVAMGPECELAAIRLRITAAAVGLRYSSGIPFNLAVNLLL